MSKVPNFFIAGAPKCGTSSLYDALSGHERIFMPDVKEPKFFCKDIEPWSNQFSADSYAALFEEATERHSAIGEASAIYLYSSVALEQIRSEIPDARILVMLRDPVKMCQSWYGQCRYVRFEDQATFRQAWDVQEKRKNGAPIPDRCPSAKLLYYKDVCSLGTQLENLYGLFPREQIHLIFFDDFISDTHGEYLKILAFLGVEDDGRVKFEHRNAHKTFRLEFVEKMVDRVSHPEFRTRIPLPARLIMRKLKFGSDSIRKLNAVRVDKEPISAEFELYLREVFRPEVHKLAQLTGRCLDAWL